MTCFAMITKMFVFLLATAAANDHQEVCTSPSKFVAFVVKCTFSSYSVRWQSLTARLWLKESLSGHVLWQLNQMLGAYKPLDLMREVKTY